VDRVAREYHVYLSISLGVEISARVLIEPESPFLHVSVRSPAHDNGLIATGKPSAGASPLVSGLQRSVGSLRCLSSASIVLQRALIAVAVDGLPLGLSFAFS
jgi:hypothetical protein